MYAFGRDSKPFFEHYTNIRFVGDLSLPGLGARFHFCKKSTPLLSNFIECRSVFFRLFHNVINLCEYLTLKCRQSFRDVEESVFFEQVDRKAAYLSSNLMT